MLFAREPSDPQSGPCPDAAPLTHIQHEMPAARDRADLELYPANKFVQTFPLKLVTYNGRGGDGSNHLCDGHDVSFPAIRGITDDATGKTRGIVEWPQRRQSG